jgi:secreted Zn-dependent insulinase-like peptidase
VDFLNHGFSTIQQFLFTIAIFIMILAVCSRFFRVGMMLFSLLVFGLVSNSSVAQTGNGDSESASLAAKKFQVNGYDVYLINTHQGNGVAFTVNVQTGSWHDEPVRHAGRAHLWEHVIHGGSRKYPGHKTIWSLISELGAKYNAYTSDNRTFYHFYVHPESLPKAASVLGAMVSEPDWNEETYSKELSTVKNEAKEYQLRDERAFSTAPLLYLTPKGHPLAMYAVGTQDQLNGMSVKDLKMLFYSNYQPGSLQVIVAGNFDPLPDGSVPVSEAEVLALVRENFHAPDPTQDPEVKTEFESSLPKEKRGELPGKEKTFPDLLDSKNPKSPRYLEIGTSESTRKLSISFQSDANVDPYVQETLLDYLGLSTPGSFSDTLKKAGLATGVYVYARKVNNLNITFFHVELTEKGSLERQNIVRKFFDVLHLTRTNGIPGSLLSYLKTRNFYSYEQMVSDAESAAEFLGDSLSDPKGRVMNEGGNVFNFREHYSKVTNSQIKSIVQKVFPVSAFGVTYMGPEVGGTNSGSGPLKLDPIFQRPMRTFRNESELKNLSDIFSFGSKEFEGRHRPQIISIPLQLKEVNESSLKGLVSPPKVLSGRGDRIQLSLKENHFSSNGGLSVGAKVRMMTIPEKAALAVYFSALKQRHAGVLDYLNSFGVKMNFGGNHDFSIDATGNAGAVRSAVLWCVREVNSFVPTNQEIAQALEMFEKGNTQAMSGFTGHIARTSMVNALSKYGLESGVFMQVIQAFRNKPDELAKMVHESLSRSDLVISGYGHYSEEEMESFKKEVERVLPYGLTDQERAVRNEVNVPIGEEKYFWKPLDATKTEAHFGWARAYAGPESRSREGIAFRILADVMGKSVFQINRIRNELGYVHSAAIINREFDQRILFFGQVEGAEKLETLEAGWNEVLQLIREQKLSDDEFKLAKQGILRKLRLLPGSVSEELDEVSFNFYTYGDFKFREKLIQTIENLSAEEIYTVGKKYLFEKPTYNVVASRKKPTELTSPAFKCKEFFDLL